MAVTYDEISYKYIEKGLKNIINDEFKNVYVSPIFSMRGTECIRIMVESSDNEETTNSYEQRVFNLVVRYYQKGDTRSEKVYESIRRKADRLRKHLIDNQVKTTSDNWAKLEVVNRTYNVENEDIDDKDNIFIAELEVQVTNFNHFT